MAVVTDNTGNNDTFVESLQKRLRARRIIVDIKGHHVGCGAHVFHLGAKDFIKKQKPSFARGAADLSDIAADDREDIQEEESSDSDAEVGADSEVDADAERPRVAPAVTGKLVTLAATVCPLSHFSRQLRTSY